MSFSNVLLVLDSRHPAQAQALWAAAASAGIADGVITVCEAADWVAADAPRVIRENQYDLVIKSFAGHSGTRSFAAVQEDRELIRSSPCPVWLVNVEQADDNGCIIAALDMPPEEGLDTGLNQHIVRLSKSFAIAESRPLHFVHAWRLGGESRMRASRNPATHLEADRRVAREESRRKNWLENTITAVHPEQWHSGSDTVVPGLHVLQGQARKVIPDLAGKLGAGLIVLGDAVRTGASGPAGLNTAETILPRSDSSMLIVKEGGKQQFAQRPTGRPQTVSGYSQ